MSVLSVSAVYRVSLLSGRSRRLDTLAGVMRGLAAHRRREAEAAASAAFDEAVGIVPGAASPSPLAVVDEGDDGLGPAVPPPPLAYLYRDSVVASVPLPRPSPSPGPAAVTTVTVATSAATGTAAVAEMAAAAGRSPKRARSRELRDAATPPSTSTVTAPPSEGLDLLDMDSDDDFLPSPSSWPRPSLPAEPTIVLKRMRFSGPAVGSTPAAPAGHSSSSPLAASAAARRGTPDVWPPPASRARPPRHPVLAPRPVAPPSNPARSRTAAASGGTLDVHGRVGPGRGRRTTEGAAALSEGARQELLDDVQYRLDGIFPPKGARASVPLSRLRRVAAVLDLGRVLAQRARTRPGADALYAVLRPGGLLREVVVRLLCLCIGGSSEPCRDLDSAVILVIHLIARHADNALLFDATAVEHLLDIAGRWSPTDLVGDALPSADGAPASVAAGALAAAAAGSPAAAAGEPAAEAAGPSAAAAAVAPATAAAAVLEAVQPPRRTRRRRLRASSSLARPSVKRCILREILVEDEAARACVAEEQSRRLAVLRAADTIADIDSYVEAMLPSPRTHPHVHSCVVHCVGSNGWTVSYLALSSLASLYTHARRGRLVVGAADATKLAWRCLAATFPSLDVSGDQPQAADSAAVSSTTSDASLSSGDVQSAAAVGRVFSPPLVQGTGELEVAPLHALQLRCVTAETLRILEYVALDRAHAERLGRPRSAAAGDVMSSAFAAIAAGGRCHRMATLLTLEPLLAAALKVLINLSNNASAALRMDRLGGVNAVLTLLAAEAAAVEESARTAPPELLRFAAQDTYDLRVLSLTLLTSIVTRCPAVGQSFPSRQPARLEDFELGGLGLLLQMVDRNGRVGGCRAGRRATEADSTPEQRLASGYLSFLLGALAASGPVTCELIRQVLPPGGLGLMADALSEFLDFQASCGVPVDDGMEERYTEIQSVLRRADAAAGEASDSVFPSSSVSGASLASRPMSP